MWKNTSINFIDYIWNSVGRIITYLLPSTSIFRSLCTRMCVCIFLVCWAEAVRYSFFRQVITYTLPITGCNSAAVATASGAMLWMATVIIASVSSTSKSNLRVHEFTRLYVYVCVCASVYNNINTNIDSQRIQIRFPVQMLAVRV